MIKIGIPSFNRLEILRCWERNKLHHPGISKWGGEYIWGTRWTSQLKPAMLWNSQLVAMVGVYWKSYQGRQMYVSTRLCRGGGWNMMVGENQKVIVVWVGEEFKLGQLYTLLVTRQKKKNYCLLVGKCNIYWYSTKIHRMGST